MSDLIKRETVLAFVRRCKDRLQGKGLTYDILVDYIESIPSAERKGEWILESGKIASFWVCSECDFPATVADEINDIKYFNFCPNCGARMKGAEDGR